MISNNGISFVIEPLNLTRKLSQMIISLLCTKGGRCRFAALKNKLGESKPKKTIVSGVTNALLQWYTRRLLPTFSFNK